MKLIPTLGAMLLAAQPSLARALPQSVPAAAIAPTPAFTARLGQLVALLNGAGKYELLFSPAFRQAIPHAQFQTYVDQLQAQGGTATHVESINATTPWQATVTIGYQRIVATMLVAVDPAAPHAITGLRITTAEPRNDSFAKLHADFAKLHGSAGFGVYTLGNDGIIPVAELKGDTAAPLGSAFKLWVLAEAAREIGEGKRHWTDVVRVGRRSLPSGILQKWPENAPVTLQTLATLMISISDNTAADTLLNNLGQAEVGTMMRTIGVADPDRTLPVLTTMQAFELKAPGHAALAEAWAKDSPEARAKLLADNAAAFDGSPINPQMFAGKPLRTDSIEWFASPEDMAKTLNWLRLHGDDTVRAILAVNHGTDPATAGQFDYVGFKGGSEPGVITLNYLVQSKAGQWYAVTGNWHDPDASVSTPDFAALMNRALRLVPR